MSTRESDYERGIVELTFRRKVFSRKKSTKAMKPAVNFSHLVSVLCVRVIGKENKHGDRFI